MKKCKSDILVVGGNCMENNKIICHVKSCKHNHLDACDAKEVRVGNDEEAKEAKTSCETCCKTYQNR